MSILQGIRLNYSLFGPHGVFLVAKTRLLKRPCEVKIAVEGINHPIQLRLRTTDVSLLNDIVMNSEYDWDTPKMPRAIVDAGANIGMASIFFANKYPDARIIAIEPEPSNFEMLKKNTSHYPNILAVHGALWNENKTLSISDPGEGEWGFQTSDRESRATEKGINVRGITLDKLMDECGIDYIDVLKIDIEGSEKEVFENSVRWIDKVGMIAVELHDRFKSGCSSSVYSATKAFDVSRTRGETIFFARKELAQSITLEPDALAHSAHAIPAAKKRSASRCKILSAE
jgi:FkbM family methyltransferase